MRAPDEGIRWLRTLLDLADSAPLELRAHGLRSLGSAANPAGEDALAEQAYRDSLALFRELDDRRGIATLLLRLGYSALYGGDTDEACELAAESLALHRANGNERGEAQSLSLAGEVAHALGETERALELINEGAELAGKAGFTWWRARTLRASVDCAIELGRRDDAEQRLAESLDLCRKLGDRLGLVTTLARLARLEGDAGNPTGAGLLWGAVEGEESRVRMGGWEQLRERLGTPVLAHAGDEFERGREAGRRLSLEEAVDRALDSLD